MRQGCGQQWSKELELETKKGIAQLQDRGLQYCPPGSQMLQVFTD
jgi:hypothetical protein